MNAPVTEEQIRTLAHRLWEEAGSPESRADEFWILAQHQLANEPAMGAARQSELVDKPPESA